MPTLFLDHPTNHNAPLVTTMRISLHDGHYYCELTDWRLDQPLLDAVRECVRVQRECARERYQTGFVPDASGKEVVSEGYLRKILATGQDIHGISTQREISNVIVFNSHRFQDSVNGEEIAVGRKRVDELIAQRIERDFLAGKGLSVSNSGHFWYPPGGYMSWHTNSGCPGWRLYVTYAEQPGKSFFRYRDVASGSIVTSYDDTWDFRMFEICRERPLWHAVYSDTHRFSLGFVIRPRSLRESAARKLHSVKRLLAGFRKKEV